MNDSPVRYQRVLLKLSGEALMGELDYGIEPSVIQRLAAEIATARETGIEIAIVIGGGNIFRGAGLARANLGSILEHRGRLDEARALYISAIKDSPELRFAYSRLAIVSERMGRRRDAIRLWRALAKLSADPTAATANAKRLEAELRRSGEQVPR